jgi:hypothetical protein
MPVRASCFEVLVGEVVVEGGAHVFVGDVDAADALVVSGKRHRHMRGAVEREGVVGALDAQNAFVGAEVDLDHHVLLRQFLQQGRGVVLVHHVDAVADALGVAQLDGLADVEAQALGRHQAGASSPACRLMWTWGKRSAGSRASSSAGVVAHGDEAVLGLDEVDALRSPARGVHGGLDGFKAEQRLREDLLRRKPRRTW